MMRIAIVGALLLATDLAASAENCTIPTDDPVAAQTAKCLLSVDGRLLVNERCNLSVSPDTHGSTLDAEDYVEVNVIASERG